MASDKMQIIDENSEMFGRVRFPQCWYLEIDRNLNLQAPPHQFVIIKPGVGEVTTTILTDRVMVKASFRLVPTLTLGDDQLVVPEHSVRANVLSFWKARNSAEGAALKELIRQADGDDDKVERLVRGHKLAAARIVMDFDTTESVSESFALPNRQSFEEVVASAAALPPGPFKVNILASLRAVQESGERKLMMTGTKLRSRIKKQTQWLEVVQYISAMDSFTWLADEAIRVLLEGPTLDVWIFD